MALSSNYNIPKSNNLVNNSNHSQRLQNTQLFQFNIEQQPITHQQPIQTRYSKTNREKERLSMQQPEESYQASLHLMDLSLPKIVSKNTRNGQISGNTLTNVVIRRKNRAMNLSMCDSATSTQNENQTDCIDKQILNNPLLTYNQIQRQVQNTLYTNPNLEQQQSNSGVQRRNSIENRSKSVKRVQVQFRNKVILIQQPKGSESVLSKFSVNKENSNRSISAKRKLSNPQNLGSKNQYKSLSNDYAYASLTQLPQNHSFSTNKFGSNKDLEIIKVDNQIASIIKDYQDETLIEIESKRINNRAQNPNKVAFRRFEINKLQRDQQNLKRNQNRDLHFYEGIHHGSVVLERIKIPQSKDFNCNPMITEDMTDSLEQTKTISQILIQSRKLQPIMVQDFSSYMDY
ncbi:UNKNOWN [Stylonychia lemnae]|uniref:Uncharacterized protein n=1 Tax=Stylonychia lemnae TaxID=5949 RepID=A0A078B1T7_STYLE|nr:UNKNOWN [Stylonychia lemnae]|eukprot:CDW88261.1 UNKNOWN [Stylonychia lemnae]